MIRRVVPFTVLPLALLASGLASSPWLRAFPFAVIAAPLFGAAVLSALVPFVAVRLGIRWLSLTALIDVAGFVLYELIVALHEPTGTGDLVRGLVHGPSQVLSFALPLVSPRTLLVAPVALAWLAGAISGECVARRWFTVLPYGACLVTFGLAYAGTVRAASGTAHDVRLLDTALALALLVVLLLLRVTQSWVRQEVGAQSTQADGILPLRGLLIGTGTALIVALIAAIAVQSSAFTRRTTTPQRFPSLNNSRPLSPVSFIAGLRPTAAASPGQPVFRVSVDRTAPPYFGIANVDFYDGDGWSFTRRFLPSGGILPADGDPALDPRRPPITQRYTLSAGPLTSAPWMPYLYRPQQVTGTTVNIDPTSGMVVPSAGLRAGQSYTVRSAVATSSMGELSPTALPATSAPPIDTQIPGSLRAALATVINAFAEEMGTSSSPSVPFLQALLKNLQTRYALAGPATTPPRTTATKPPTKAATKKSAKAPSRTATKAATKTPAGPRPKPAKKISKPATSPRPTPTPTPSPTARPRLGGVSFADVLASIVGPQRSATPEQYATLFALVARQLGVPARLVTGFRLRSAHGGSSVAPGSYDVTTADAWTWVEIPIRGSGWVVGDPAPSSFAEAKRPPTAGGQPSPTPTATPTRNALITQSNAGHAVAPKSVVPHKHAATKRGLILALLIGFGVLAIAVLLVLVLRKRIRAWRRRRAADPRRRLLGAWQESLDVLTESGLPDLSTLTNSEIVVATGERFGPEPAGQAAYLGRAANAAIYSTASRFGPSDAAAAWSAHTTLRRLVRRRLGMGGRLAAGLRYHRVKTPRTPTGPLSWASSVAAPARGRSRRAKHRGGHRRS